VEHFDVIVVGAGISGIGAGYHLQRRCPDRSFVILEGRADLGGTWDLFRYPGIRSDSDMHTLGYSFEPWGGAKAIADGPSILAYLRRVAAKYGIDQRIRFNQRVVAADWSSADARWTVTVRDQGQDRQIACSFLFMCSGYYNYTRGYTPELPGIEDFGGPVIHPQDWPETLDYEGKRVVVIGSGATAATLVPELARHASHVTMLQRSPTYMVARPASDAIARALHRILPARAAHSITRWKNILLGMYFFRLARRRPERVKRQLIDMARAELAGACDVDPHFTPRYNPWDQRICLVPDADLFESIRSGRASVVTDTIRRIERDGVALDSGERIGADILITATGLDVQMMGGMAVSIDGRAVNPAATFSYKGMMFSGIPNLAAVFGYTNASWTLKAELVCRYVCRLLNAMRHRDKTTATPQPKSAMVGEPFLDFSSGYVRRAVDRFPRQGDRAPWRVNQNYLKDIAELRFAPVDQDMVFDAPGAGAPCR